MTALKSALASRRVRVVEDAWVGVRVCDARRQNEVTLDSTEDMCYMPQDRKFKVSMQEARIV